MSMTTIKENTIYLIR